MIKSVIFDFGNVLFDLNYDLFYANFSALLDEEVRNGFPEVLVSAMEQYEKGKMNTETFIWNFQHYKNGNIAPLDIINCWNSLLVGLPEHRFGFLATLTSKYKLYLLSNINELHLSTVYKHVGKVCGEIDYETKYFDAVFYSHMIGLSKPGLDIYEYVQDGLGLKGEEILFIDDRLDNVQAAKTCGWNAIQHEPEHDIVDVFDHYISQF